MANLRQIKVYFLLSSLAGVLLSYYAYNVEMKKEENSDYTAMCDISEHISCTKVFSSKYGKGFGIMHYLGEDNILNQPNGLFGINFYVLMAVLSMVENKTVAKIQMGLNIVSIFLSFYLACILYFILFDFCLVCVSTYIINIINLILSIAKWRKLSSSSHRKEIERKIR